MLFSSKTPDQKRKELKEALNSGKLLRFPGAFAPVVSMLIEQKGFEGVYISGAVLSGELGLPDIGMTTMTEVVERGSRIAAPTDLPSIIDIDTGFGEPMNVARTVRELEEKGICGCHLEDQENPKRCGHLDHKNLVDAGTMGRKIKAAREGRKDSNFLVIARTDARGVEGLDAAVERARQYVDAGAEMIFPEALKDEKEFEYFRRQIDVPLLANMTEFGKSPLLSTEQLSNLGYNMVIYPVSTFRLAMKAVEDGLEEMMEQGTQDGMQDRMQERKRLYEIIRYEDYNQFDQDIFNFKL